MNLNFGAHMYKDKFFYHNNVKGGKSCIGANFLVPHWRHVTINSINCYKFKVANVIPMITTKKLLTEYIQKEMRGNKNVSL